MMIDRVGGIDPVQNGTKVSRVADVQKKNDVDSVAVSSEATEKGDLYRAIELVSSAGDVRADRIAELKQKINDPDYINETVVKGTADRIMESFGL